MSVIGLGQPTCGTGRSVVDDFSDAHRANAQLRDEEANVGPLVDGLDQRRLRAAKQQPRR